MLNGPLFAKEPCPLTIASDYRFGEFHPEIDAVWTQNLRPGEPLWLRTSLGLQAQSLRIFPSFILQNQSFTFLESFFSSPRIDLLLTNYMRISFGLQPGLAVSLENWAAASNRLLGRIELSNENNDRCELEVNLSADLVPQTGSTGMSPVLHKFKTLLQGTSSNLALALGMEGPARVVFSPLPALCWRASIPARARLALQWRLVIESDLPQALAAASEAYPANYSAEVARVLNRNRQETVHISEAQEGWHEVLAASQMLATQLVYSNAEAQLEALPQRNSDTSHPELRPASLSPQQKPQLHPAALRQVILALVPGQTKTALSLLRAYLQVLPQDSIEKPLFPCLAALSWELFTQFQDKSLISFVYPILRDQTLAWFNKTHDQDYDGLPEWESLSQTMLFDQPGFEVLRAANQATPIQKTESSALTALLLDELHALESMAQLLSDSAGLQIYQSLAQRSRNALAAVYARNVFGTWDRDTHARFIGEVLYRGPLQNLNHTTYTLTQPQRLLMQVFPSDPLGKPLSIKLDGLGSDGKKQEEQLGAGQISWLPGFFFAASQKIYTQLNGLHADGQNAELLLYTPSLDGFSIADLYAWDPLLAEQNWVNDVFTKLENETLYGLPETLLAPVGVTSQGKTNPVWTSLLIDKFIKEGETTRAFNLLQSWVRASIRSLNSEHSLFEAADASNGRPYGNRSAAAGILPLNLVLRMAGVHFMEDGRVQIAGANPFPWPIGFRYRGVHVLRDGKNTRISFPNGELQHHFGSVKRIFEAKNSNKDNLPAEDLP